jgi:translation initiation factor 4E
LSYEDNLKPLSFCRTVEEFFASYCYLKRASQTPVNSNLHFFREGLTPMWEFFPEGGCWILRLPHRIGLSLIDKMWESALLACIGESLSDKTVGVLLSTRFSETLIQIWLKNVRDKTAVMDKIRSVAIPKVPRGLQFYFKEHR